MRTKKCQPNNPGSITERIKTGSNRMIVLIQSDSVNPSMDQGSISVGEINTVLSAYTTYSITCVQRPLKGSNESGSLIAGGL